MPLAWSQDFKHIFIVMQHFPGQVGVGYDQTNNCLFAQTQGRDRILSRSLPPLFATVKVVCIEHGEVETKVVLRKLRTSYWPRLLCDDFPFPFIHIDADNWRDEGDLRSPSPDSFCPCECDKNDEPASETEVAESLSSENVEEEEDPVGSKELLIPPCVSADIRETEEEEAQKECKRADDQTQWCSDVDVKKRARGGDAVQASVCKLPTLTLCRISLDALMHIMSFLPASTLASRCCLVSSKLNNMCSSKELWKTVCERDMPNLTKRLATYVCNLRSRAARHRDPTTAMVRLDDIVQCGILNANILDWTVPVLTNASLLSCVRWKQAYRALPLLTPIAIADQRNNRIKITRCDGSLLHAFTCNDMQAPSGIVLLRDNRLAITEFLNSRVLILNSTGAAEVSFSTGHLPRGIAQLPDGNLVVCQFGMGRVTVHNLLGETLYHLNGDFYGPSGVAVLDDGNIAVTECNGNRIRIHDPVKNVTIRIIGFNDTEEDELDLEEPRGIAVLRGGLLAVCDGGSNRITITTTTGRLIRHIAGNFRCPAGIAALPDGDLIAVTDTDHHRVCIVRWTDGRILKSFGTSVPGGGPNQFAFPRCIAVLNCL